MEILVNINNDLFMKNYGSIIMLIIILLIIIYNVLNHNSGFEKVEEEKNKEFNSEIKGTIRKTYINHGILLLELYNNKSYSLMDSENSLYNPSSLCLFVKKNDSIYKPINSYNVYIYREGEEYYFELGNNISKNKP